MEDKLDIFDVPGMEEDEFQSIYDSVKDSPEAVNELDSIMREVIERMEPLVAEYEAVAKRDPKDVSEDEILKLEEEKFRIEENRMARIQEMLKKEVQRKKNETKELLSETQSLMQARHRIETGRKIYPNDPCPCGSGLKYKKCCGRNVVNKA